MFILIGDLMEDYALYVLTGAIFGSLVAVVYQLKLLVRMDKKILAIEKRIESLLKEKGKRKSSK